MPPLLDEVGLFYCAAVWGSTFYLVKGTLSSVSWDVLVAYRFLLSAALLLPWVLRRSREAEWMKEAFFLALLLAVLYLSQTAGLKYTSAANSGFITGLFVVFVPAFMLLFHRKRPSSRQWACSALAFAGLWLLTGGIRGFNRGDALTLLAAMTYAGHLLATDRFVKAEADPVLLAFHQFWMTGVLALALAGASGSPLQVVTRQAAASRLMEKKQKA
ncbi:MAG: DMT family transporter [Elusimicrobia bacterium]|nr:DMT family transporter [Elusimicrobiota bacterium]